jgi:NADP-reducing hydrogenase subunit HndB
MAIHTLEELVNLKEKVKKENSLSKGGYKVKITVHLGTCGIAAGGEEVHKALKEEIEASKREDIKVVISGCAGMCSSEPNVTIERLGEDAVIYRDLDAGKIRKIFKAHVLEGEILNDHAMARIKEPV